jgi:hypothetical protein
VTWHLRRTILLILFGVASLTLGTIVLILNKSIATDLLAGIGILGGLAMILNVLPENGHNDASSSSSSAS